MKRFIILFSFIMATFVAFGQNTVYYQQIDKKVSVGIGKTPRETKLVLLTNKPTLELIVNDTFVKTECNKVDKNNYEHIVTIPNFTLELIKNNLKNGSVFVDGREYSALEIGAAIAAAEWYCSYYADKKIIMPRMKKFTHRPFFKESKHF